MRAIISIDGDKDFVSLKKSLLTNKEIKITMEGYVIEVRSDEMLPYKKTEVEFIPRTFKVLNIRKKK